MEENSEYRVTRHKGSGPDGKDTKVIFSHLDEDPARKFYERHLPPTSGTVLALWKPDGSLIAHSESGRRHDHLTIAEAALALGYSADTIRRGVVRGTGPLADLLRDAGRKTNEGWIISLTDEQIARHRKVSISQPMPPQGTPAYARLDQPEPTVPVSTGQHEEVLRERLAGLNDALPTVTQRLPDKLKRTHGSDWRWPIRMPHTAPNGRRWPPVPRLSANGCAAARTGDGAPECDRTASVVPPAERDIVAKKEGMNIERHAELHADRGRLRAELEQAQRRWWHRRFER